MGQVVVKVNGREFPLSCADGQEPRIRRLAQYVDAKVGEFTKTIGQVGEARLLLLAALVIADELSDANEALQQERNRAAAAARGSGREQAAASGIRGMAERIEAIAARLRDPLAIGYGVGLRGALGRLYPGADIYLLGAVPVGVVASVHGAHLRCRATEGLQRRRPRRLHPRNHCSSRT